MGNLRKSVTAKYEEWIVALADSIRLGKRPISSRSETMNEGWATLATLLYDQDSMLTDRGKQVVHCFLGTQAVNNLNVIKEKQQPLKFLS